jgi:hypothetical protein
MKNGRTRWDPAAHNEFDENRSVRPAALAFRPEMESGRARAAHRHRMASTLGAAPKPGPQPSATFTIAAPKLPIGAGVTAALAAVARPSAKAALKRIVFPIMHSSPQN